MRLRKKPWARPELETCEFFIKNPIEYKGRWLNSFTRPLNIHLELGCGKGGFISKLASANPEINYIAIDIKDEVLVLAKRKIEAKYAELHMKADNIKLMSHEIMLIHNMLGQADIVKRIYINFCNPWTKNTYKGRRLTHTNQLNQYKEFLAEDGEIWFKTDDDNLFYESLRYFEECNFEQKFITYDLHNSAFKENVPTEHEMMFAEEGKKIKFLIAKVPYTV